MKIKKYIDICTQHESEVERAIKYNAENNYEFIIRDTTNLIGLEGLKLLLKWDYEINPYTEQLTYVHKHYNYEKEKIEDKEE